MGLIVNKYNFDIFIRSRYKKFANDEIISDIQGDTENFRI